MKKKTSLTKAIDKNPNIFVAVIFCSVIPFFLPAATSWFLVAAKIALCAPAFICVWLYNENYSVWQNAVSTVSLLLISFTSTFFPAQIALLLYMLCFAILIALLIYVLLLAIQKKMGLSFVNVLTWLFECIALLLLLVFKMDDYAYISYVIFPLWQVGIILGILVGGFITLKWLRKQMKFWGCLGSFLLLSVLAFMMFGIITSNLNFALDTSRSQEMYATVVDTEINTHSKSPNTYSICVEIDGEEISIHVPGSEYKHYEPGDTFFFKKYEGAFDEPFYIANAYS